MTDTTQLRTRAPEGTVDLGLHEFKPAWTPRMLEGHEGVREETIDTVTVQNRRRWLTMTLPAHLSSGLRARAVL